MTAVGSDEVRLATDRDSGIVAEILSDGFRSDPVMCWVFGDAVGRVLKPFFHFMVGEALIPLGATYVSSSSAAVWTPPGMDPWARAEVGSRFLTAMDGIITGEQLDRVLTLNVLVDEMHPKEPHWYLGMLATRSSAQGSGAGGRIMTHTLARVDGDRLPSYLESTNPRNVPFYERHGFVVVGEARLPDGPPLTQMRRAAPAPG